MRTEGKIPKNEVVGGINEREARERGTEKKPSAKERTRSRDGDAKLKIQSPQP